MVEWKMIESAPKDGTEIDLWAVSVGGAKPFRVPDCAWKKIADKPEWVSRGERGWESLASLHLRATHWMPLPAPPFSEGGKLAIGEEGA